MATNPNVCLIIFSRNRPDNLVKVLRRLEYTKFPVFVVDDSPDCNARSVLGDRGIDIHIFDREVQNVFLDRIMTPASLISLVEIGRPVWNLGAARNFGLLIGLSLGFEIIIFCDDDIHYNNDLNPFLSKILETGCAGAEIVGELDYSVLDHFAALQGLPMYQGPSGGFLGFQVSAVAHHFMNVYNEDLIWLRLHQSFRSAPVVGTALQATEKHANDKNKQMELAVWQEYGEVLLQGVSAKSALENPSLLTSHKHWKRIIASERASVISMAKAGVLTNKQHAVCKRVEKELNAYQPESIALYWKSYFITNDQWLDYINKTRGQFNSKKVLYEIKG